MTRSFKCCKNKDFLNYCCVECLNIFHPSCLERCSQVVKLGGYKIFCSEECQTNSVERENQCSLFKKEIESLEKELNQKDRYIERLRRSSQVFEDVVSEAEKSLTSKLDNLNQRNSCLETEMQKLKDNEQEALSQLESFNTVKQNLEREINELSNLNRNLIVTIETLEKDNMVLAKEIKMLQRRLETLTDGGSVVTCQHTPSEDPLSERHRHQGPINATESTACDKSNSKPVEPRRQLLIVGGQNARGCALLFKRYTGRMFDVNCQVLPRTFFSRFVTVCGQLCANFSKNDHVVIFTSDFNVIRGKPIEESELEELLKLTSLTNISIVGCSYHLYRPVMNDLIHDQNDFVSTYLMKNNDINFVPIIASFYNGLIDYETKREIILFLLKKHNINSTARNFSQLTRDKSQT